MPARASRWTEVEKRLRERHGRTPVRPPALFLERKRGSIRARSFRMLVADTSASQPRAAGVRVCETWSGSSRTEAKVVKKRSSNGFRRGAVATALILSLVSSAYVAAFAIGSGGHAWLGWIILPPLFVAIRTLLPVRAMACGALWGVCVYLFAALVVETGVTTTLLSFALLAAAPAIYAYLCARVTRGLGFCALLLGFGWIGVELALKPLGLHHGLLAGTQGDGALVHTVGGLFGSVFVAFVIAFVNAALLSILSEFRLRLPRLFSASTMSDPGRLLPLDSTFFAPLLLVQPGQPRAPPVVGC